MTCDRNSTLARYASAGHPVFLGPPLSLRASVSAAGLAGLWCLAISLGTLAIVPPSTCCGDEKHERRRAQLLEQMRSLAEQTKVRLAKADRQLELAKNPAFRYDDQPRRFIDA